MLFVTVVEKVKNILSDLVGQLKNSFDWNSLVDVTFGKISRYVNCSDLLIHSLRRIKTTPASNPHHFTYAGMARVQSSVVL